MRLEALITAFCLLMVLTKGFNRPFCGAKWASMSIDFSISLVYAKRICLIYHHTNTIVGYFMFMEYSSNFSLLKHALKLTETSAFRWLIFLVVRAWVLLEFVSNPSATKSLSSNLAMASFNTLISCVAWHLWFCLFIFGLPPVLTDGIPKIWDKESNEKEVY